MVRGEDMAAAAVVVVVAKERVVVGLVRWCERVDRRVSEGMLGEDKAGTNLEK